MLRACVLLVAATASLCGLTMADVTLSKTQITPSPGKTNSVTCTVTGETFRGWFKPDNTKVSTSKSDKIYVETTGNAHKLKLTDVKVSYGGTYECRGSLKTASLIVHVEFDTSGVVKVQHIEIGKDDTIKLGVTGYPEPKYTWKKGTTVLNPKSNSRYTLLDGGSLKISKVTRSDRGNYTCDIEQDGSEDKVEIEVYAVEHPEIKPFAQTNRYLTEDYPATFLCEATGYPPPQYKWYSPKGTELNSFGNIQIQGGNLTFIKVTSAFEKGEYKCKAYIEIEETKEQVGEDEASVKVVDVYVAPKIDPTQGGKADLKKGNDFKMTCKATGNPLPTVTWTRNGVIDPRQQNIPGQSVIEFRNIQVGDSGVYTCEAKNTAVDNNGNIIVKRLNKTINVESKPVIDSIASPSNVYSFVGNSDPTLVRCKYGGYPTPWVVMTFGGKVKSNSTGTAEIKVITNAIKYFGDYKCYARNKFGWTNYTVKLQKADSPSEVQNLKAEPTCDSVKLSWIRPNDNGGMPINKYVLNYEAITRNVDGDATTYTIRKLKRNTKYSITLRATNRAEWGPISSVETETTQYCAPGRPIIYSPKSSLLTTDSLTLKWRRPENTGGDSDITYTLRYRVEREGNPGPWTEITTKELEADITELDDKVDYRFELTAKNQGGESGVVEKYFKTNFPEERGSQSRLMSSAILTLALGGLYLLL